MKYLLINAGLVAEVIPGEIENDEGRMVPIEERYHPGFLANLIPVEDDDDVQAGYVAHEDGSFSPWAPPPPTADEIRVQRDGALRAAALRIAPLQDAADLDEATDEELATLKRWKQYRVALSRIEAQAGFPANVQWPEVPQ